MSNKAFFTQGIQAQTLSVLDEARKRNLKVVGAGSSIRFSHSRLGADYPHLAVNKWDLVKDDGRGEAAVKELSALLDCEEDEILRVSAKTGLGVESVLEGVVARIPPPQPYDQDEKLRALAFDSYYDTFRGVVSLVAVVEGEIKKGGLTCLHLSETALTSYPSSNTGDQITSTTTGLSYPILDLGILSPREISIAENPIVASRTLRKGMVGWVVCAMKDVKDAHLGDTFHHTHAPMPPLESFEPLKSMVFAGCYPMEPGGFPKLEDAIKRVSTIRLLVPQSLILLSTHSSLSPIEA